jgi:hypothetical protein
MLDEKKPEKTQICSGDFEIIYYLNGSQMVRVVNVSA